MVDMNEREILQLLVDLGYYISEDLYDKKCDMNYSYSKEDRENIAYCISEAFEQGCISELWVSKETEDQLIIYVNREYKTLPIEF